MTDADIIDYVLQFEGGYVDNPADRGGPTKFGITAADYGAYLGLEGPATAVQVSQMPQSAAVAIYRQRYIEDPGFAGLATDNLRLVLVDSGVLFGTGRAARWLQQSLNVAPDGAIGPVTTAALAACADRDKLARGILAQRFRAIAGIVAEDASQRVFLRGWTERTATLLERL